jgi:hypothetical protein
MSIHYNNSYFCGKSQKTEDRRRKSKDGRQKTEDGSQKKKDKGG